MNKTKGVARFLAGGGATKMLLSPPGAFYTPISIITKRGAVQCSTGALAPAKIDTPGPSRHRSRVLAKILTPALAEIYILPGALPGIPRIF